MRAVLISKKTVAKDEVMIGVHASQRWDKIYHQYAAAALKMSQVAITYKRAQNKLTRVLLGLTQWDCFKRHEDVWKYDIMQAWRD